MNSLQRNMMICIRPAEKHNSHHRHWPESSFWTDWPIGIWNEPFNSTLRVKPLSVALLTMLTSALSR